MFNQDLKIIHMKVLFIFCFLFCFSSFSQEFKLKAANFGVGVFYAKSHSTTGYRSLDWGFSWISFFGSLSFNKGEDVYSIKAVSSSELNLFSRPSKVNQINIQYSRELFFKRFYIEPFVGGGCLRVQNRSVIKEQNKVFHRVSLPLQLDLGVKLKNSAALGISNEYNLNNLAAIYNTYLFVKLYF